MLVEKMAEALRRTVQAIAIPLKEGLGRRRKKRPRIGVNPGAKKEDEDEEAAEDVLEATF